MNLLQPSAFRRSLCSSVRCATISARTFTSTPHRHEDFGSRRERVKPTPESPSFYTTRAVYHDQVVYLEKAIARSHSFLRANHLLPLPEFARASLPPLHPVWKDQYEMAQEFQTRMTTSRYRKVVKLLNQLNDYQRITQAGNCPELGKKLNDIITMFESSKKEAFLARGKRKPVVLDQHGRSYTLGKRKTSSARVWMIPVQSPQLPEQEQSPEELLGLPSTEQPMYSVTTTTILVNNLPLNEFFPLPADREKITRPLKVAGVLGKYNVFAIVRGGGTSGQSGALAHGIAKGVVAHEPELETMFRRAKLTWRDPRMVERKKTGLAKARKAYAWVKR
ncbi:ribosomal protein S9/S16-domain-containing protein [Crassisporium funariophilum]|nr:ribosomal protein S9/S16-domain-containing protein [Crassisporium funariophilum]